MTVIFGVLFAGTLALLLHMAYDIGFDRGWDAHNPPIEQADHIGRSGGPDE